MRPFLTTGGTADPFLPHLLEAIRGADQIDLAVAFIKSSGLAMIYQALDDALDLRGARLRVLTSDYLHVTDPQALRSLMLLAERGADIRVFEAEGQSFHLKAYICTKTSAGETVWGAAFVGSSNLSRTALTDGLEWNLRVAPTDDADSSDSRRFREIRDRYETLFTQPQVQPLDYPWIEGYEARRRLLQYLPVAAGCEEPEETDLEAAPEPSEVQREALAALAETREQGFRRGLVVMATGLGKTYLAAFDSQRMGAARVLFVAHREEILLQAEASFQRVHPDARVGHYRWLSRYLSLQPLRSISIWSCR